MLSNNDMRALLPVLDLATLRIGWFCTRLPTDQVLEAVANRIRIATPLGPSTVSLSLSISGATEAVGEAVSTASMDTARAQLDAAGWWQLPEGSPPP